MNQNDFLTYTYMCIYIYSAIIAVTSHATYRIKCGFRVGLTSRLFIDSQVVFEINIKQCYVGQEYGTDLFLSFCFFCRHTSISSTCVCCCCCCCCLFVCLFVCLLLLLLCVCRVILWNKCDLGLCSSGVTAP